MIPEGYFFQGLHVWTPRLLFMLTVVWYLWKRVVLMCACHRGLNCTEILTIGSIKEGALRCTSTDSIHVLSDFLVYCPQPSFMFLMEFCISPLTGNTACSFDVFSSCMVFTYHPFFAKYGGLSLYPVLCLGFSRVKS